MNDIIKDVIVNCLENLMINRIIEKDKKQLEVRMQEKQIKMINWVIFIKN